MALHLCASAGQKNGIGALRKCKSDASDASDASDGGGRGGGVNPMHRTHRILMRAIGWVAVKIFLTSGVHASAGSYC